MKVKVNYQKIAEGILALFSDSDMDAFALGMLPAVQMECLKKCLTDKSRQIFKHPSEVLQLDSIELMKEGGIYASMVELWQAERDEWEKEVMHEVACELLRMGTQKGMVLA